jgi:hypothetical protein
MGIFSSRASDDLASVSHLVPDALLQRKRFAKALP